MSFGQVGSRYLLGSRLKRPILISDFWLRLMVHPNSHKNQYDKSKIGQSQMFCRSRYSATALNKTATSSSSTRPKRKTSLSRYLAVTHSVKMRTTPKYSLCTAIVATLSTPSDLPEEKLSSSSSDWMPSLFLDYSRWKNSRK